MKRGNPAALFVFLIVGAALGSAVNFPVGSALGWVIALCLYLLLTLD